MAFRHIPKIARGMTGGFEFVLIQVGAWKKPHPSRAVEDARPYGHNLRFLRE